MYEGYAANQARQFQIIYSQCIAPETCFEQHSAGELKLPLS